MEAQGKYLQAMLERAQKSLSGDMNGPAGLEAARAQLTDFNSALSKFVENMNKDSKGNVIEANDYYKKTQDSTFQIYQEGQREESKDHKPKIEGASIQFDLNIKGSHDFVSAGGAEMESKMLPYRV